MGFFDTVSKIVKGEPVFGPQMTNQPQPDMPAQNGPKEIPQVYIDRVDCNEPGNGMQVDVYVKNYSRTTVEVDYVEFWGRHEELDKDLVPGQEFKFRIYDGPRMRNTGDNQMRLSFKTADTGDYFLSHHYIEFKQEADNTYSINRIIFRPPVQDVY